MPVWLRKLEVLAVKNEGFTAMKVISRCEKTISIFSSANHYLGNISIFTSLYAFFR